MTDNVDSIKNFEWALKNGELDQVKNLVEKDISLVNKQFSSGRIPLCIAADYGQLYIIEYLISKQANVNVVDKFGMTPLLSAIYEGHTDCVRLLVQKGANKNGKSPDGTSYLECADTDEIRNILAR